MPITHVAIWSLSNAEHTNELTKFTRSIPTEPGGMERHTYLLPRLDATWGRVQASQYEVNVPAHFDPSCQCGLEEVFKD